MTSPEITDALRDMIALAEAEHVCLVAWNGSGSGMNYDGIMERARAALAAGAPGVKVKALVWVEEVADLWWSADCYRIEVFDGGGFAARVRQPRMHVFTTLAFGVSFEAAKAAAQADYEARILSALEHAPSAPVAEPALVLAKRPVAFRVKDHADGWILFQDEDEANAEAEYTGALMQGLYVRDGTPMVAEPGEPVAWEQRHRENSGEWSKWYPTSKKAFDLIGTEPDGSLQARPLYAAPPARQDGALREALEPFAKHAGDYEPPEGDDDQRIWGDWLPTIGDLRRARAALEA